MSANILRRAIEEEPKIIFKHIEPLVIYMYIQYIKENINFRFNP